MDRQLERRIQRQRPGGIVFNPIAKLQNAEVSLVEPSRWSRLRRKRRDDRWIRDLCQVAAIRPAAGVSPTERFNAANPNLKAEREFHRQATEILENDPSLMIAWQAYSSPKRPNPKPKLEQAECMTVWIGDNGERHDPQTFKSEAQATAWFIWIETTWLIDRRGLTGRPRRRLHRIRSTVGRVGRILMELILEIIFSAF